MTRIIRAGVAGASALALALLSPVATASAQEGETIITNTETVNVSLDPSGNVDVARVYDQIAIQGSGEVAYTNPVSTEGLRNLDAFGGFTVEEGSVVEDTSVDGQLRRRALSDFDQELPVTVSVVYSLDGQEIDPAGFVGKSGSVEVAFRIENMTCAPEEISYDDGLGGEVTETMDVCDPFAGSLSFTLPSNYTDVVSDDGFLPAGDGRGGTLMNLSVAMISGLTDPVQEASYSATVSDAVIPPVTLSFLPLIVESNTSTAPQLAALQGGAETGAEIASNGEQLDENVLALASGAVDVVNGIIQLDDGAAQLSDGLVNVAAPGASQLADGLNQLNGQVPALVDGVSQLNRGGQQVAAGATGLNEGLAVLSAGVDALPQTVQAQLANNADYQRLLSTLKSIINGIGTPTDQTASTLLGGLNLAKAGLRWPGPSTDCDVALAGGTPTECGAMDAVDLIAGLLGTGAADLDSKLKPLVQGLYFGAFGTPPCGAPPNIAPPGASPPTTYCDAVSTAYYALFAPAGAPGFPLGGLENQASVASSSLRDVSATVDARLVPGLTSIQKALFNDPCNPAQTDPKASDFCGIAQALGLVQQGIPQLVDQLVLSIQQTLEAGIGAPTAGCDPTATLRCGSAALAAGANELADGLGLLSGQTGPLASGVDQLADGSNQLADGLGDAADGSVQLAAGTDQLAEAAPALPQNLQRLSAEGTSLLVEAGEEGAQTFGQRVALLKASAERTADGGLPYGGPEDAIVAAAYRYDLSEATGATAQNTGQLLAGVVIAGAAVAGATVLARRKTA